MLILKVGSVRQGKNNTRKSGGDACSCRYEDQTDVEGMDERRKDSESVLGKVLGPAAIQN